MTFTDRFGNVIQPGHWVVYGRNLGRCATTCIARVAAINVTVRDTYGIIDGIHQRLQEPTVKLVLDSVRDDQGYSARAKHPVRISRVTVHEIERVIRYDAKLVSSPILEVMREYLGERGE